MSVELSVNVMVNGEAMAHWGAVAPKTNKQTNTTLINFHFK